MELIDRFLERLRVCLEGAAEAPRLPLNQLPVLTSTEEFQVLHHWQGKSQSFAEDYGISDLVARWAQIQPAALAVRDGDRTVTYGHLLGWADDLAHQLTETGVSRRDRVAVQASQSVEAIVAYLAVLRAGATYIPFDFHQTSAEKQFWQHKLQARAVLSDRHLTQRRLHGPTALTPYLISTTNHNPPPHAVGVEGAPAYILPGAGRLGHAVPITSRSLLSTITTSHPGSLHAEDVVLHAAHASSPLAAQEIWGSLGRGAQIACGPRRSDPASFAQVVRNHQITAAFLPTTRLHRQVVHDLQSLSGIRLMATSGAALNPTIARRMRQAFPMQTLLHGYTAAESAGFITIQTVDHADRGRPVPVGRPLPNGRVYILDERNLPVAPQTVGELYVAGPGLADSYLDAPSATRHRFLADPFRPTVSARMFRTGDLACWQLDGTLQMVQHNDQATQRIATA
ncbi:AMP-binding protein [Streptomyces sp. NPDC007355]|uniref:AMP-binding protein n=1 Tax=Streptomyces sp. NPDC007355 TaxID=3364778 RepID=UPI0036B299F9